jgi:hypothetical protein
VALVALFAAGVAVYGGAAKARPTGSAQLLNPLGEDDLGKFAVVDMATALERVTAQDEAAK